MSIGILTWRNETGLMNYPLASAFGVINFILDANFIQFDNTIPVLKTVQVTSEHIYVTVTTDAGDIVITLDSSTFVDGKVERLVSVEGRYLGKIIFGLGAQTLWSDFVNQTIELNISFLPIVVQSIASTGGLYSLHGAYGNVRLISDGNLIFTNVSGTVKFDAIGVPTSVTSNPLKTINGVSPTANAIFLQDSDTIKLDMSLAGLTINLVTDNLSVNTSIIPTI